MKKIGLIWDLDGTLINSENEVLESLIKSVKKVGLTEELKLKPFRVGPTIDKILEDSFSAEVLNEKIKKEIITEFRSQYDNCGFSKTLPIEGIVEILKLLNVENYIVTNKPDLATNRIISKLGWKDYFKKILTPYTNISYGQEKKTKTELFSEIVKNEQNILFFGIGDMATDAIAAKNNNINAIGVLWGTGTQEELEYVKCNLVFSNTKELFDYLKSLEY